MTTYRIDIRSGTVDLHTPGSAVVMTPKQSVCLARMLISASAVLAGDDEVEHWMTMTEAHLAKETVRLHDSVE